jgi:dTMP kinase
MYICLEGIDGAGKSTQVKLLGNWLEENGYAVEMIVEPTSSPVGVLIREMLQNTRAIEPEFQKMLGLLFAADRLTLKDKILENEENFENKRKIMLSDRCFYSSLAYQSPFEWITEINKYAKRPDLVIFLDIDVKTAVSRCQGIDKFENESFLKKVSDNYRKIRETSSRSQEKENFILINANNGQNLVHHDIKKVLAPYLGICVDGIID